MSEGQPPSDDVLKEDEELLKLPAKQPRSVIMALTVIGLAGLVSYQLRADLRYAFRSKTSRSLGDVQRTEGGLAFEDNTFVTIEGIPDRRNALFIEERGARSRETFFRLLGTIPPLFVRSVDSNGRTDLADRFTGRLRRFDSQPYAETLRAYFAKETHATHYLDLERLRNLLPPTPSGPLHGLRDRAGHAVSLSPETPLGVMVLFSEDLLVRLPKDKFPTVGDAQHELERLGFSASPRSAPALSDEENYAFILLAPAAERSQLVAKLDGAGFPFSAHEERLVGTLATISTKGPMLRIGDREVAWREVQSIGFDEPIVIGHDALVLSEGERPGDFWWAPLIEALLIAFALFNLWYLARAVRKPT